jgi:hypothetical protein
MPEQAVIFSEANLNRERHGTTSCVRAQSRSRRLQLFRTVAECATLDRRLTSEEQDMNETKRWTVHIDIDEHDGRTRAVARLHPHDSDRLVGVGLARLNPADHDVPEIGDELATARALSELSHNLLELAAADIEQITHKPAHLHI